MEYFLPFWLLVAPNFVLLLLVKCIDGYIYKKEMRMKKAGSGILWSAVLCVIVHLPAAMLAAKSLNFPPVSGGFFLPLVIILLFAVVPLLLTYRIERSKAKNDANQTARVKNNFQTNLKIVCGFILFYFILTAGSILYFADAEWSILGETKKSLSASDYTQIIGTVGLMAAAVLYKTREIKAQSMPTKTEMNGAKSENE